MPTILSTLSALAFLLTISGSQHAVADPPPWAHGGHGLAAANHGDAAGEPGPGGDHDPGEQGHGPGDHGQGGDHDDGGDEGAPPEPPCGADSGDTEATAATRAAVAAQCDCATAHGRGRYLGCVAHVANGAVGQGFLRAPCRDQVMRCAARSTCGRKGFVTCCRTDAS